MQLIPSFNPYVHFKCTKSIYYINILHQYTPSILRRRVFKKVRLSGLGGAWGDLVVESSVALVCLYLHGCVGIVRVVSDNRPGYL